MKQFNEEVKNNFNDINIKYCSIGVEYNQYFYVGLDNEFNVVYKDNINVNNYRVNKHNIAGVKKQAIKKFCENNNKIHIPMLMIFVDGKILRKEYLIGKYKEV